MPPSIFQSVNLSLEPQNKLNSVDCVDHRHHGRGEQAGDVEKIKNWVILSRIPKKNRKRLFVGMLVVL